jgi:hypothetical protein
MKLALYFILLGLASTQSTYLTDFGNQNFGSGVNNKFSGTGNKFVGNTNTIHGNTNQVLGNSNDLLGNSNKIKGNTNDISGSKNLVTSSGNVVSGSGNIIKKTALDTLPQDLFSNIFNPSAIPVDSKATPVQNYQQTNQKKDNSFVTNS